MPPTTARISNHTCEALKDNLGEVVPDRALILTAAITGSRYLKTPSTLATMGVPAIPYSVDEAVQTAIGCYRLGARMIHVHSRGHDGSHTCDQVWYEEFAVRLRKECPDVKICFATSRAGKVLQDIQFILASEEAPSPGIAEIQGRSRYLERTSPDFLTSFTSTEEIIADHSVNPGHVAPASNPEVAHQFVAGLSQLTRERAIGQELEITSLRSMDIIEQLQREGLLHGPLHFIILPNFTRNFPFNPDSLNAITARAQNIITTQGGAGLISLGLVLEANNEPNSESRRTAIQYALANPHIHGLRIGIEDAPYSDGVPSSNEELMEQAVKTIRSQGGDVSVALPKWLQR